MNQYKQISHEIIYLAHEGRIWLKKYKFHKIKKSLNQEGQIENEIPFTQLRYLITMGTQSIWLSPEQTFDLKTLLEEHTNN